MSTATFTATVENEGGRPDTKTANFSIPGLNISDSKSVDLDGGEQTTISFTVDTSNKSVGQYDVIIEIDGEETRSTLEIVKLYDFEIRNFSSKTVARGQTATFSFDIYNNISETRETDVEFEISSLGISESRSNVSVNGNSSTNISFDVDTTSHSEGNYTFRVYIKGDSESKTLKIEEIGQPVGYGNIFIFIDESRASDYDNSGPWNNDLSRFNSVKNGDHQVVVFGVTRGGGRGEPPQALVPFANLSNSSDFNISSNDYGTVIDDHQYFPDQIRYVHVDRPPDINTLRQQGQPSVPSTNEIFVIVDSSGSVRPRDVEPTLTEYLDWIKNEIPSSATLYYITTEEVSGSMEWERWLGWAADALSESWNSRWRY